ncbi:rhomboid family intramembrane serine protease [uncultured Pontibacter sp.]|uniref:rhomboid family intramembrane serine protease n=1 Tax=uncultured Pontibacter sp. TaxID=453356 RepID=UPI00262336A8|nr:rhomboid family intramembrane serine protease [uncultured Pontibacter sp.]
MKTDYAAQAEALSTEELQSLLLQYKEYDAEAVLAVLDELERRQVEVPNSEQLKHELLQAQEPPQPETLAQKAKNFLQLFVPQPHYFVTPILLNLNLLVFVVGALLGLHVLDPDAERLVDMGANFGPYTLTGEWWRLFTSMFLHGGLLHLLFNMLALVNIGTQLEALVGKVQYTIAYVLTGLAGSIASLWWTSPEITVSVGASGAIFGLFGMLLMVFLLEREMDWKSKRGILANMVFVIGINLAYGMRGGIDNAAHIGGLVAGLLYGGVLLLRSGRYITQTYGTVGNAVTVAVGVLVLFIGFSQISFTGTARYVYTWEVIGENEQQALKAMFAMDKAGDNPDVEEIVPLLENGIQLWEESETLLESIDDAPESEQARVTAVLDYVRLRKLSYQMLRDDLQAGRPLLHEKQQQMLSAINHYAVQLQKNDFSDPASAPVDAEIEKSMREFEEMAPDSAAMAQVFVVLDGVEVGKMSEDEVKHKMQQISPYLIKSVKVLKGPEAVAIYGAKAAAGAILVSTQK